MTEKRIGFVGTDGRTLLAALETSRSKSELYPGAYRGVVVQGTRAMPALAQKMGWPVDFIPVANNSAPAFAEALIRGFQDGALDVALIMPEALIFDGLVDLVAEAGHGGQLIGLNPQGCSWRPTSSPASASAGRPASRWPRPGPKWTPGITGRCWRSAWNTCTTSAARS